MKSLLGILTKNNGWQCYIEMGVLRKGLCKQLNIMNFKKKLLTIALICISLNSFAETKMVWHDFTNRNRDNAELEMNLGSCNMVFQQASMQAESRWGQERDDLLSSRGFTLADVGRIMAINSGIQNYADNAFINCMKASGWEAVTADR